MKKILITIIFITISSQLLTAQNLKRANHLFERRAYLNAAELYLKEDIKTQEIYEKLGDCYYFNTKMKEAVLYYKLLISKFETNVNPTYYYRYAQALKGVKNFTEADIWLEKYAQKNNSNQKKIKTVAYFESLNNKIKNPYTVQKIKGNSKASDFGAAYFNNSIVFASSRGDGQLYTWNNLPYLDLYKAKINKDGDFVDVVPFSKNINSKKHESNAVFTKDGKTMYFTRNNFLNGKKGKDAKKVTHLKIYKAELIENKWTNIIELPFNSKNYSAEHPALNSDETQLYFASDMPGSIGLFDLFVVDINKDGTYGTPKNLGTKINTIHREQFPFISANNTLYFASDGHVGLGGLDIFKSNISASQFSNPENLSNPINSNLDDFAFITDENDETGYISSNRGGGIGNDDIYRFTKLQIYDVKGLVQSKKSLELLPGANVKLFDNNNVLLLEKIVGDNAEYSFKIDKNSSYKLKATHKLYVPYEVEFSTDSKGNINKNIQLLLEQNQVVDDNIVVKNNKKQIKINPIFFDFNKWNIRPDAATELNIVVLTMKKYPEMKIEIGAHTDCRGGNSYNLSLSNKRAESVKKYLVSQGIPDVNIEYVGYGETQPLNDCIKEGMCTDEEYDINRRCEFVILN